VAGQKQRHDLVAQLLPRHRAFFVGHRDQIRQQGAGLAAAIDDRVDLAIDLRGHVLAQEVGWRRHPRRKQLGEQHLFLQNVNRPRQPAALPREMLSEQGATHDAQRKLHHFSAQIEDLPVAQAVHEALRFFGEQARVALDALVAKTGLDAAALASPLLAIAGEEPVTE
jgi:hypothetical protein